MAYIVNWQAKIFDGVAPIAWTDLDLTSVGVPATRCLVFLRIAYGGGGGYFAVRPADDGDDWYIGGVNEGHGAAMGRPVVAGETCGVIVPTDGSGKISWRFQNANALVAYIEAYLISDYSGNVVHNGAMPVAWTGVDVSAETTAARALAYLRYERTGGVVNQQGTRPGDEAGDYFDAARTVGGVSQGGWDGVNQVEGYITVTDVTGTYDHIAAAVVPNVEVRLLSFEVDGFTYLANTPHSMGAPPTSWTDLGLGPYVGNSRALVVLAVERSGVGGKNRVAFRRNGLTDNYLLAADNFCAGSQMVALTAGESSVVALVTDINGEVEWIADSGAENVEVRVLGFVSDQAHVPEVYGESPEGATTVLPNFVGCSMTDDFGLDMTTLNLTVTPVAGDPLQAIVGGSIQTSDGWGGTIIQLGGANPTEIQIQLTTYPDFLNGRRYIMTLEAENIAGQSL
jgi:hypothetical protein